MNYLQPFKRGRASNEDSVREILQPLVNKILQEREGLGFSPTLRGWCYLLEGLRICTKGDFNDVQSRITRARKLGMLPLDITAEDDTRSTEGGCFVSKSLDQLIALALGKVVDWYSTCTIEEYTGVHLELVVEKLDLVGMLATVTRQYKIPVTCSRGWSDLHSRAALLKRCAEYDVPTVVLMFGDHDPGGLSITDSFKDNLDQVFIASGLEEMPDISFERVGLNAEDIDSLDLLWIDGLETSSGGDLGSTEHTQHNSKNAQEYIARFGKRKCEANALLRNPAAAEKLLLDAISQYIDDEHLIDYQDQQLSDKKAANHAVDKVHVAMADDL